MKVLRPPEASEASGPAFRRHVLGLEVSEILEDPAVIEVMVNADGGVWVERFGSPPHRCAWSVRPGTADRTLRLLATHAGKPVTDRNPRLSATLPTGERFQGELAPLGAGSIYALRKPAARAPSLTELLAQGVISNSQLAALELALSSKQNILVAGATSSGKTTFANALLNDPLVICDRIIILEDTLELRCRAENHVQLRTQDGRVSMSDLLYDALRLRPDRIVIGEVRDGAALDILKAWNTGHPGGMATLHANSAQDSLNRLEELVSERTNSIPRAMIARSVNVVAFMRRAGTHPILENMMVVEGLSASGYNLRSI